MAAYNKIVYAGRTLVDLTSDTVTPARLAKGATAHDKTGALITGTASISAGTSASGAAGASASGAAGYNRIVYSGKTLMDLSGDTVTAAQLFKGTTAHDKTGALITGAASIARTYTDLKAYTHGMLKAYTNRQIKEDILE